MAVILLQLGPVADRLSTRAVVAQYEADIGDPAITRYGTSLAGTTGPLPRFIKVRDALRVSYNIHAATPPTAVPLRLARSGRTPTDDNLSLALPYAPSLRAALELVARYGDAVLPWYWRRITSVGDELHIAYGPVVPLGRIEALATEVALTTIHRIVELFVGSRIVQARVNFACTAVSSPGEMAVRFNCPVATGGPDSLVAIPAAWAELPNPYHDPVPWQEGLARCEADIQLLCDPPLLNRVRAHLSDGLDRQQLVTIAETAQSLGLSPRTLVRQLTLAGTSHHLLLDTERRQRAWCQLAMPGAALAEIAESLCFTDTSSFGRKCRLWFGESPARLRRQLMSLPPGR